VASFSLHGWLWIACALPGTWLGVHLRPLFGLDGPARRGDGRPTLVGWRRNGIKRRARSRRAHANAI
jgi:hypothetical protein